MTRPGGIARAIAAGALFTLVASACAKENGAESAAVESTTSTTDAALLDRMLLPDSEGLRASFATDPDGSTDESLVFYANPRDPDAGYVQVRLWDEEPSALASQSIEIGGVQGWIDVTESVGQLAFPSGDQWVLLVSGGLDIDQLRTVGESVVVAEGAAPEPRLSVEASGLPEGWVHLDARPHDFVTAVQADDPTLPNAWIVRYDQADPHEGTDLHTGFIIIGQPENDDLLAGLEALANEFEPIEVRDSEGAALQLGHLGTTPPLYMNGIAWNEGGQTLLAVGLNRSTPDVATLVEDLEHPSPEAWDELTE